MKKGHWAVIWLTVCALPTFTIGCLDMETDIRLNGDGSGRVILRYDIPVETFELGVFDRNIRILPLPIGKDDFEDFANRIDGLRLLSYRSRSEGDRVAVQVKLRFADLETLDRFYLPAEDAIVSDEDGYRQLIFSPSSDLWGEAEQEFAEQLLSGYSARFLLRAPRRIVGVNRGDYSGRQAGWELPLTDIFAAGRPLWWQVDW